LTVERLQRAFDNFVLNALSQFGEERAETGYPDHEVAVIFRMFLCVPEDGSV
jgi:hypothetical protein